MTHIVTARYVPDIVMIASFGDMMDRTILHLVHSESDGLWHIKENSRSLAKFLTKSEGLADGQRRGNELDRRKLDAQLVVHREDGSIEIEYIYGHDPLRARG